ncbi:MAG: DUF962 domain-containing protein [Proteobacteria bacterium]|nr:DUF962 domain-containing protein [Pseudomonadota bacterium]
MSVTPSDTGAVPLQFASFREFYPYYLEQHSHPMSRRLHVLGSLLALAWAVAAVASGHYPWALLAPLAGYVPAWIGHFFYQRNTPATFRHPLYSLVGDWVMVGEVLTGRRRF